MFCHQILKKGGLRVEKTGINGYPFGGCDNGFRSTVMILRLGPKPLSATKARDARYILLLRALVSRLLSAKRDFFFFIISSSISIRNNIYYFIMFKSDLRILYNYHPTYLSFKCSTNYSERILKVHHIKLMFESNACLWLHFLLL